MAAGASRCISSAISSNLPTAYCLLALGRWGLALPASAAAVILCLLSFFGAFSHSLYHYHFTLNHWQTQVLLTAAHSFLPSSSSSVRWSSDSSASRRGVGVSSSLLILSFSFSLSLLWLQTGQLTAVALAVVVVLRLSSFCFSSSSLAQSSLHPRTKEKERERRLALR